MTTQDNLDRRDPFRFQMFNSEINYVSHPDPDEDEVHLPPAPDSPPAALATLASPPPVPHDEFYLDPSLASNVARLPSPSAQESDDASSEALFPDDEPDLPGFCKTDRSGESTASSLLSIKELLAKNNSFFLDDGDALMKVISSAMDFGAPPNLMTLYTKGHISKNQLLNFLRLDSQHWYSPDPSVPGSSAKLPIDLSDSPSHGTTLKDPIVIDDSFEELLSPIIAASTNHLGTDPPSTLRESSSSPTVAPSTLPTELDPQLDNGFDGRNLNSFST
jgi:hypothetical protein